MMRIAMLAAAVAVNPKVAHLRIALGGGIAVDSELGVIKNAAVLTVGEARGHGFSLDKTSLTQLCNLINAEDGGVKVHFKHPETTDDGQLEDQLGAIVGRLKNCRIEGDCLRGDVHIGDYAKALPGLGDARTYLLGVAKDDPSAIGLSAVFAWEPDDDLLPKAIVARISKVFQVDFVGEPAGNPNGLLSATAKLAEGEAGVGESIRKLIEASNAAVAVIRQLRDATATMSSEPASVDAVIKLCESAGAAAQSVTVAARECIDAANTVPSGTNLAKEVSDSASVCIRLLNIVRDECLDALETIAYMGYGTSDLAKAVSACSPLLCTCADTSWQCPSTLRSITAPMAALAARKNVLADRGLLKINKPVETRRATVLRK